MVVRDGLNGLPVDWQRHWAGQRVLVAGGTPGEFLPGVTHRGDDIGRRPARQVRDWARLNPEPQHHLDEAGAKPAVRPQKTAARTNAKAGADKGSDAFTRGIVALAQYIAREGKHVVARQHVEHLPDGTTVRSGVFLSNQKNRRDRLSEQQLAQLAAPGPAWAA